jgi:pilus assembly protein FimV
MRRNLPRLLLTGALLSPATLWALGLGEIRLNSSLNQPFDADIELIAPTREELADLKVSLASNELFQRYELDRPAYLSSFSFTVSRGRDGNVIVKVRSSRSITEPFVTFLVEANSSRSRLLREYTVLLDPPMFMPSQPSAQAPVTAPQSGVRNEGRIERAPTPTPVPSPRAAEPERPVPSPEPVAREEQPAREEPSSRSSAAPAAIGGTYNVQRNDTLSGIASQIQPGSGRRVINQTMIALFRANPRAFAGDNINRLRAGSVLRVPELAEIEAVPPGEASQEVARQTEAWSGVPRAPGEPESSRLRLVTPAETPTAPTPAPTPTDTAPERTASTPPSNATGPADKRLQVTSPELSSAQQSAAETPSTPAPSEPVAEAPAAAEQPAAEAEPAPPPRRPRPQPAAEQPPAPSIFERISDFWLVFVIGGIAVLVALLLVFVKRRREASELDALDAYPPMTFEPRGAAAQAFQPAAPKSRDRADAFLVEGDDEDKFDEPAPVTARRPEPSRPRLVEPRPEPMEAPPPVAAKRISPEDTLSSETAVRFDQQDALAEADFHMAYGLYDQAADLVKIAISREPARRDLKLKLLEIYFVWGNRDLFLETAGELYETRDQSTAGEWDKVLIMGKQIAPEDSMFKGGAGAHMDLVDVNLEGGENRVDVDLFAEPDGDQVSGLDLEFVSGERRSPRDASDSDLDLLLDDEQNLDGDDNEPTREMDPLARTQETPTIESPQLDRSSQTIRERVDKRAFSKNVAADQTAELSLDDLGLDVDSLEQTGSLEQTASLDRDTHDDPRARSLRATVAMDSMLGPDDMTQLAPSLSSFDRTVEVRRGEEEDTESTGTIYIDQVDLSGSGDTVEQQRPDIEATSSMRRSSALDFDLDGDNEPETSDTVQATRRSEMASDRFSDDVFNERTSEFARIDPNKVDLDVGEALSSEDHEPTNKQTVTNEMELSELEPVTMSEVGTKLDLARAYMDMGDPDGARSILEEVLAEGTANQKQEAQRLLDSIR